MPQSTYPATALLQQSALRQLIRAGASGVVTARGGDRGYEIHVQMGNSAGLLVNAKSLPRHFASLSTVATLLGCLGCLVFTVDTTDFTPGRIRPAQPARSLAMKAGKLPKLSRPIAKR